MNPTRMCRCPALFIPGVDIPKTVRECAEAAQRRAWRESERKRKTETSRHARPQYLPRNNCIKQTCPPPPYFLPRHIPQQLLGQVGTPDIRNAAVHGHGEQQTPESFLGSGACQATYSLKTSRGGFFQTDLSSRHPALSNCHKTTRPCHHHLVVRPRPRKDGRYTEHCMA